MDADGDGRIAQEEWQGPPPAFRKLDTDADGFLTFAELEAMAGQGKGQAPAAPATTAQATAEAGALPWIDSHIHLRKGSATYEAALRHAVELMDAAAMQSAVVMPPPFPKSGRAQNRYDAAELSRLAKAFPGRFVFLGGGSLINGIIESTPPDQVTDAIRGDFAGKAASILDAGARGFGEMGMMHMSHFPGHPSYWVSPDHPLFLLLADIAGARRAIIDIHMDVVERDAATPEKLAKDGRNPPEMKANLAAFERFVAHNRQARIVLVHAGWDVTGQWSAQLSRRLLSDHPNLYMSLKNAAQGTSGRNRLLTESSPPRLSEQWLAVFTAFPDRFVIGSDSFFAAADAKGGAPGGMTKFHGDSVAALLAALPEDLARRIAWGNALALYGAP